MAPVPGFSSANKNWLAGAEWQPKAAFVGWLTAFGKRDHSLDIKTENERWYIDLADAEKMLMHGTFPEGYKKQDWGCLVEGCTLGFAEATSMEMPCDDDVGFWEDTTCPQLTGTTCHVTCQYIFTSVNATCFNGQCVCPRDENGVAMCAVPGSENCQQREDTCKYFGENCARTPADNPGAPMMQKSFKEMVQTTPGRTTGVLAALANLLVVGLVWGVIWHRRKARPAREATVASVEEDRGRAPLARVEMTPVNVA